MTTFISALCVTMIIVCITGITLTVSEIQTIWLKYKRSKKEKEMKKIKFALISTLLVMSIIFIPVALGYVSFIIFNEIMGVVIGITSFIFIFFLVIAFTSDWQFLK